jgi:hypothetical protein
MNKMADRKIFLLIVTILLVSVIGITSFFTRGTLLAAQTDSPESLISRLTELLEATLAEAEFNGGVTTDENGNSRLTGSSAQKVDEIYQKVSEIRQAMDERPPEEREKAKENIRRLLNNAGLEGDIQYQSTASSPYDGHPAEYYVINKYQAIVDIATDRVLQLGPSPFPVGETPIEYNTTPLYTPEELEQRARTLLMEQVPGLNLDELVPSHGDKLGTHLFYRWEKNTEERIQVGFTVGGDFLSYSDTLVTERKVTPIEQ